MQDSHAHGRSSFSAIALRVRRVGAAWLLLTFYWIVLRVRPRTVLRTAVSSPLTRGPLIRADASHINDILSAVERAAALHPMHPHCLEQALASRALLARSGEDVRVVIGVSKTSGALAAHAWIEVNGYTNDASRPRFVELTHLP